MTIIAALFSRDGDLALVSDILLSVDPIPAPHRYSDLRFPFSPYGQQLAYKRTPAGFCQKICILHPLLCVAFTGSEVEGRRAIAELRAFGSPHSRTAALRALFDQLCSDYPKLGLIAAFVDTTVKLLWSRGIEQFAQGDIIKGLYAGNGSEEFSRFVGDFPAAGNPEAGPLMATNVAIGYMAHATSRELYLGEGLAQGWGGGFEVVRFTRRRGFHRMLPIIYFNWNLYEKRDSTFHAQLDPGFIYQYSVGAHTGIYWHGQEEAVYGICAPDLLLSPAEGRMFTDAIPIKLRTKLWFNICCEHRLDGTLDVRCFGEGRIEPKTFATRRPLDTGRWNCSASPSVCEFLKPSPALNEAPVSSFDYNSVVCHLAAR
jgi:hypothetical protein